MQTKSTFHFHTERKEHTLLSCEHLMHSCRYASSTSTIYTYTWMHAYNQNNSPSNSTYNVTLTGAVHFIYWLLLVFWCWFQNFIIFPQYYILELPWNYSPVLGIVPFSPEAILNLKKCDNSSFYWIYFYVIILHFVFHYFCFDEQVFVRYFLMSLCLRSVSTDGAEWTKQICCYINCWG